MAKNPAAVCLGRLGGLRQSPAQQAWNRQPKPGAGRPSVYRLVLGCLERRQGTIWTPAPLPYTRAARAWLRRH